MEKVLIGKGSKWKLLYYIFFTFFLKLEDARKKKYLIGKRSNGKYCDEQSSYLIDFQTRFGPNRVAADIQGNGEDDFLVKIGLWFRMKLRFRMNLWPKLQYI